MSIDDLLDVLPFMRQSQMIKLLASRPEGNIWESESTDGPKRTELDFLVSSIHRITGPSVGVKCVRTFETFFYMPLNFNVTVRILLIIVTFTLRNMVLRDNDRDQSTSMQAREQ